MDIKRIMDMDSMKNMKENKKASKKQEERQKIFNKVLIK